MKEISSIRDPIFQRLRLCRTMKGQQDLNCFLVEEELIDEAIAANYNIQALFTSEESSHPNAYKISQGMMRKVFPQGRPPKSVALCEAKNTPLSEFLDKRLIVILEGIQDCGNLGTILRTCEAFGVEGVIAIHNDLTHLFNRVTVRSSMGALFHLDLCQTDFQTFKQFLQNSPFELLATSPHASEKMERSDKPLAVVFGNETTGITKEMEALADRCVGIKMVGNIESLNVAVSSGIVLYELSINPKP